MEATLAETNIAGPSESADSEEEDIQLQPHPDTSDVIEVDVVSANDIPGRVSISDRVIIDIVERTVQEIDGVTGMGTSSTRRAIFERLRGNQSQAKGISVLAGQREVILGLEIQVAYGSSIPAISDDVRQNVASRLWDFCGLIAKEIDIAVTGIEFSDERDRARSRLDESTETGQESTEAVSADSDEQD